MATTYAYPPSQHSFPHCKCVLRCCANLPRIDLPGQESDRHNSNTNPSICFHIYQLIAHCKFRGRRPQDENKTFHLCLQDMATVSPEKLYTIKELVMIETAIDVPYSLSIIRITCKTIVYNIMI